MFLNDEKFLAKVLHLLVNILGYKPALTTSQFFSYGYAAPKMVLCMDVVNLVKRTRRDLQKKADLKKKRPVTTREPNVGLYTVHDQSVEKSRDYSYSRQEVEKKTTVENVTYSGQKNPQPFTRQTVQNQKDLNKRQRRDQMASRSKQRDSLTRQCCVATQERQMERSSSSGYQPLRATRDSAHKHHLNYLSSPKQKSSTKKSE